MVGLDVHDPIDRTDTMLDVKRKKKKKKKKNRETTQPKRNEGKRKNQREWNRRERNGTEAKRSEGKRTEKGRETGIPREPRRTKRKRRELSYRSTFLSVLHFSFFFSFLGNFRARNGCYR